jgi:hypothetical protein
LDLNQYAKAIDFKSIVSTISPSEQKYKYDILFKCN